MEEKRISIIKKGLELFNLYGIRSVTMDELAKEMGVSKKTLYQHFNNKNDLVTEIMEHTSSEIKDQLETDPCEDVNAIEEFFFHRRELFKKLSRQNTNIVFDLRKYYPEVYSRLKEMRRQLLYDAYIKNFKKGIQQNLYRQDLDIDFLSRLMTGSHVFIFDPTYGIFSEEELISDKFRTSLFSYHFKGICTDKGYKIFEELMQKTEMTAT
ncbi:TetR/AcrR family transcriptional regulator [Marinilabilia rubra]|nr:TetR/AcrR family transcriptional regulator [Marinilabilia rubra]